jgi:riboflavin kinase/FMN adenylyltransferase
VVAIGNFDGVHLGHRRIFEHARERAAALSGQACVLTFEPHPAKVLAPDLAPPLITLLPRKLALIAESGIDLTIVEPFDAVFAARPPESFVDEVLVLALGVREVVVGADFTYGRGRAGTVETLAQAGRQRHFTVEIVPKVAVAGMVASSTKVRELVLEGRVGGAAQLLGRPFELSGNVARGDGRGRSIGVPTANLLLENELLPKHGVYAGFARTSGIRHMAAINIGVVPTFHEGARVSVEAHLLDFGGDLYGQTLTLEIVARLRDEVRFPSVEALCAQIRADLQSARALLQEKGAGHGLG